MQSSRHVSRRQAIARFAATALAVTAASAIRPGRLLAAPANQVTLPQPEQTAIKIGHSTVEPNNALYALARDQGLFAKYGIPQVDLFYNEGDGKAVQALISGGVEFSGQSSASSLAALTTDIPLICVLMTAPYLTDALVTASDVTSADQLRGKSVAVSSFGSTSHGSVLLCLEGIGLTDQDVTIVQIGGQAARIAALKAGSVAAAPVDVALEQDMRDQGFNILIRLPDTPLEYGRNGLLTTKQYEKSNPNTVLAVCGAMLEAQQIAFNSPETMAQSYAAFAQIQDPDRPLRDIQEYLKTARRDLRWTPRAFEAAQKTLSIVNPELATVDPTQAYTYDYLDKLRDMGFNAQVGAPT
ncbi:MAG: ABC transporter substrate-binding protein [Chloroflexi bacterium]|nr:ABC transporter substrate-binding protein [Chloroflexota bacterium]